MSLVYTQDTDELVVGLIYYVHSLENLRDRLGILGTPHGSIHGSMDGSRFDADTLLSCEVRREITSTYLCMYVV